MHKLLGSIHIDRATKDIAIGKVRTILQAGTPHHSPAYAKLCNEVGLPAPTPQHPQARTPPLGKYGKFDGQGGPGGQHTPGPAHAYQNHIVSPAFNFPAFGSPMSPQNRAGAHSASPSPGFIPRQTSPYQPMFGMEVPHGPNGYYYGHQYNPYGGGFGMPMSATSQDRQSPVNSARAQEDYMQSIAAMQSEGRNNLSILLSKAEIICSARLFWRSVPQLSRAVPLWIFTFTDSEPQRRSTAISKASATSYKATRAMTSMRHSNIGCPPASKSQ